MRLSEARFEKFALLNYLYAMLDMAAVYTLHLGCDVICVVYGGVWNSDVHSVDVA